MKLTLNGAPPAFLATVGGSCQDSVQSLSLDGAGDIWVAGTTASADFPLRAPIGALGPGTGGFVAELNPGGSSLLFSTFTGGGSMGIPTAAAARSGAYVATTLSEASKLGATSALAAFLDGNQSPSNALNAIQTPTLSVQQALPVFQAPSVAPGQLILLRGLGIGPASAVNAQPASGIFPDALAGVQVSFNGIPAPLISVQANQIECQAPFELDGAASANIQVQYNGQSSNVFSAAVVAQQLGLLGVANADGSANSASNPAPIGSAVTLYLTGLGQTAPPGIDGALNSSAMVVPRSRPAIYVNAAQGQPLFFGAAPGESTAVFQLNLAVPPLQNNATTDFIAIFPPNGLSYVSVQLYVK
jgi:uncharacterized protein (TIGR03437 family)